MTPIYYFEHRLISPVVTLETGERVRFSGHSFETRSPALAKHMRESVLCLAREFVERTFNPLEALRTKARREAELMEENALLRSQLAAMDVAPGMAASQAEGPAVPGPVPKRARRYSRRVMGRRARAIIESIGGEPIGPPDPTPLDAEAVA